jgi:hypothetical protein
VKIAVFWFIAPFSREEVLEMLTASIISVISMMVEVISTFETSVSFYQATPCNNSEDRHLGM